MICRQSKVYWNKCRKQIGQDFYQKGPPAFEDTVQEVNIDVFSFFCGNGCTNESNPKNQVTKENIAPEQAHIEKIAEYNLEEGEDNHKHDNCQQDPFFSPFYPVINSIDKFHEIPFPIYEY